MPDKECPPCNTRGQFVKLEPEMLLLSMALDGIVVDPQKAKVGPCECIPTPTGKHMCWDKGIVGALSQEQVGEYCKDNFIEKKLPSRLQQRWTRFANASEECKIGGNYSTDDGQKKIESLEDRLECMHVNAEG